MTNQKTYTNNDKVDATITYVWSSKIDRENENNNAIVKASPLFMNAIQAKVPELNSCVAIKKWICEQLKIDWDEEYDNFKSERLPKAEPVTEIKTDMSLNGYTVKELIELIDNAFKQKVKSDTIKAKLKEKIGLKDAEIETLFSVRLANKQPVTKITSLF